VTDTGLPTPVQINYIIDEGEFPVGVAKGANATLSMVHNTLIKRCRGEKRLKITCDNCSGQNKNNTSFFYYCWLTLNGTYDFVEVNFMIPGHTKFICDRYFGLLKTLYCKTRINTIDDVVRVVMHSTKGGINKAIRYQSGDGWTYYDFTKYFVPHFHKIPHLKQYQHFLFKSNEPGKVFCRKLLNSEYETFTLLKPSNRFDPFAPIPILNAQPVPYSRQKYLYDEVRRFVDDPYKDITCPIPHEVK
jgi:hypothetical protein